MPPPIVLSTGSVFPNTELGFQLAAEHGFDGVELMVNHDRRSQTPDEVKALVERYGVPVRSVHVPCLVVTQPVYGWTPDAKLRRTVEMARAVDARTVVVHPPFRWQRDHEVAFVELVRDLHRLDDGPAVTVENMYTVTALGRRIEPYLFADDKGLSQFPSLTLDTSHAGADRWDPVELYELMAGRVDHLHLSDSTATKGDEHLPPGAGVLPLDDLAATMVGAGYTGDVVLEVAIGRLPEADRPAAAAACREWAAAAFA